MLDIIYMIVGILILLCGLFQLTGKKQMVSQLFINLFALFIGVIPSIEGFSQKVHLASYLYIGVLPFIALAVMVSIGKYTVINVNSEMIRATLISILEDKKINFEEQDNILLLREYGKINIAFKQSLSLVEVNLNDIREFPFYRDLKQEINMRVKEIHDKVFPTAGFVLIGWGVIYLVLISNIIA